MRGVWCVGGLVALAACGGPASEESAPQPIGDAPSRPPLPDNPGDVQQPTSQIPTEIIPPKGQSLVAATGAAPPEDWQCGKKPFVLGIINEACFLPIPGTTFQQGAQASDPAGPNYDKKARPDEGPVRAVTVGPFWIQKHEVTVGMYDLCVQAGWCAIEEVVTEGRFFTWSRADRAPYALNGVSWAGAQKLCAFLGGRLPTEAEWELAARGPSAQRFPWGNELECDAEPSLPLTAEEMAGEDLECPTMEPQRSMVGRLKSPFGLMRMAGHMWEWTGDWYGPYPAGAATDPTGPAAGTARVQRGGGWMDRSALDLRSAARGSLAPDSKLPDTGFRCVWKGG
jgi:sulfatase modifying factor 1